MATMNYVCSTSNGERTFIGCQSAREGGIGKFIDDFQKDIQIWFQFPLSKGGRKERRERKEPTKSKVHHRIFYGMWTDGPQVGWRIPQCVIVNARRDGSRRIERFKLMDGPCRCASGEKTEPSRGWKRRNVSNVKNTQFIVLYDWSDRSHTHHPVISIPGGHRSLEDASDGSSAPKKRRRFKLLEF